MKVGDLVTPDPRGCTDRGLHVYPFWGSKERGMPKSFGIWKIGEVGVVLDSLESQGGNGCEVLLGDGRKVWVNLYMVKVVNK